MNADQWKRIEALPEKFRDGGLHFIESKGGWFHTVLPIIDDAAEAIAGWAMLIGLADFGVTLTQRAGGWTVERPGVGLPFDAEPPLDFHDSPFRALLFACEAVVRTEVKDE